MCAAAFLRKHLIFPVTTLPQEKERMFAYGDCLSLSDVTKDPSRRLTLLEWLATTLLKPHV